MFKDKYDTEDLIVGNVLPTGRFVKYLGSNSQRAIPNTTMMRTEVPHIYERMEPGDHDHLIDSIVSLGYILPVVLL